MYKPIRLPCLAVRKTSLGRREATNRSSHACAAFSSGLRLSKHGPSSVIPVRAVNTYSSLDKLINFKAPIEEEESYLMKKYEGFPEYNTEFSLYINNKKKGDPHVDATIELGRQLLTLGKVNYKYVAPHSLYFEKKLHQITLEKSPEQIRRLTKKWMLESDRSMDSIYLRQPLVWTNRNASAADDKKPRPAMDPDDVIAYTHYLLPARYNIAKRVLKEITHVLPSFRPSRVLDYGCGPGTCLPAALEAFDAPSFPNSKYSKASTNATTNSNNNTNRNDKDSNEKHSSSNSNHMKESVLFEGNRTIQEYVGVDNNIHMLSAAKQMGTSSGVQCKYLNNMSELLQYIKVDDKSTAANADNKSPQLKRFDLITASYVFTELKDDPARKAVAQLLVEMLNIGGCLVIIEDGNAFGNHTVRTARQFILDAFKPPIAATADQPQPQMRYALPPPQLDARLGVSIVAPCSHDLPCPLSGKELCTFSQKAHSGMIRVRSEEQYSYVVIQRTSLGELETISTELLPTVGLKQQHIQTQQRQQQQQQRQQSHHLWSAMPLPANTQQSQKNSLLSSSSPLYLTSQLLLASATGKRLESALRVSGAAADDLEDLEDEIDNESTKNGKRRKAERGREERVSIDLPDGDMQQQLSDADVEELERKLQEKYKTEDAEFNRQQSSRREKREANVEERGVFDDDEMELDVEEDDDDDDDEAMQSLDEWDTTETEDDELAEINAEKMKLSKKEMKAAMLEEHKRRIQLRAIRKRNKQLDRLLTNMESEVDWNAVSPYLVRSDWSRVLREPYKTDNRITVDICHPSGTIRRQELRKESFAQLPALYSALRRTSWGGLFPAFGVSLSPPSSLNTSAFAAASAKVVTESLSPLMASSTLPVRMQFQRKLGADKRTEERARTSQSSIGLSANKHLGGKHALQLLPREAEQRNLRKPAAEAFRADPNQDGDDENHADDDIAPKAPVSLQAYLHFLETGQRPEPVISDPQEIKNRRKQKQRMLLQKQQQTSDAAVSVDRKGQIDTIRVD